MIMWCAKMHLEPAGTLISSLAHKHGVSLFGFPLSYSYTRQGVEVYSAGTLISDTSRIGPFISELRQQKRTLDLEQNGSFILVHYIEPAKARPVYSKDIFHIEPALISEHGKWIIHVASFRKAPLTELGRALQRHYGGRVLSIRKRKLGSVSAMRIQPSLTDRQRMAIDLAVRHGYYNVPRDIDIKGLSALAGLSFSTFQVHLRKAEGKLLPHYLK